MVCIGMVRTRIASLVYLNMTFRLKFVLECEPRTPNCRNINFFFVLRSRFTVVRLLTLHPMENYEYFNSCPYILGNIKLDWLFMCRLLTEYPKLKNSWSQDLPPSLRFSGMDFKSEFYNGSKALEMCTVHLIVVRMCTESFEPPVTEG